VELRSASRQFTVLDPTLPISLFPEGSIQSPLHQDSELSGAQAAAVSTVWGANACMVYARYEEFVLTFVAYIDRDMTIERFQRIAVYMDGAMTQLMTEP